MSVFCVYKLKFYDSIPELDKIDYRNSRVHLNIRSQ